MGHIRILHVLANSHPDTNGYAIRSHMILKHLDKIEKLEIFAITSPFYPHKKSMIQSSNLDGIEYNRCVHPVHIKEPDSSAHRLIKKFTSLKEGGSDSVSYVEKNLLKRAWDFFYYGFFKIGRKLRKPFTLVFKVWEEKKLMKKFENEIIDFVQQNDIDIIHAHTPYRVGYPALCAARITGKQFIYEARGIWEETAVANGKWRRKGIVYRRFRNWENRVFKSSDRIIAISDELRKHLISRGFPNNKITVIENGVEILDKKFKNGHFNQIKKELDGINSTITIGYIGSLRELEGVNRTAIAISELVKKGYNIKFFCLTGKDGQADLSKLCKKLEIQNRCLIRGPVPHSEVSPYYGLIDIFVVSRPDFPVTRIVTPLKPFEAMAHNKAVVVSNLPALSEIIEHEVTGIICSDNSIRSLEDAIMHLIENEDIRYRVGSTAGHWVRSKRNWDTLAKKIESVYDDLGSK